MPECVAAPKVRSSGSIDPAPSITLNYPRQPFDTAHFPVEEKAAIAQLRQFCQNGAGEYEQQRDFPAVEGTSRLSASLATGGLSPRQCLHRLLAEQPQALDGGAGSIWLNELIWREFYRHLITYYPSLCKQSSVYCLDRPRAVAEQFRAFKGLAGRQNGITRLLMLPCVSLTAPAGCITGYG
ncbi:deoxyribodipyrimidine photolyase, FAD-binding [Escherichia coli]|uniref:Deoxyribodipyrimidine photolyase, FAD-binding n=1 Tax=Escherichia coli TaxID=562 RepID=A0A376LK35_ECOLX|nr:deoxyribodipyrimidine photolyase, FAD-binding [Escherichia coli]